jgi:glycosyltransferase involved in cell wall biosynthesis
MTRRRPDIVHTHLSKAGTLGRLAARRAGVKVLMHTYHGHVLEGYFSPAASRAFREVERRLARITDVLIAISPEVRDELIEAGIGHPSQWVVVPLGLELDGLLASELGAAEARSRLGLSGDGPVVGIVGRLAPVKDHETFFQAIARLVARYPEIRVIVAGDGPLRSELERGAKELLGDRVLFLGWVNDLEALYAALDVVVLTSKNEGTPVALIEAGAAQRPSVATDVGGVPNVVRDGATGLVVAAGSAQAASEAIDKLLADPHLRQEMGREAREWVRDRFSLHRLVDEMADLYDARVAQPRSGTKTRPA